MFVVIDPGHGKRTNLGTIVQGTPECELTLLMGLELAAACGSIPGVSNVMLTREGEDDVPWKGRADIASQADVLVSIHINHSTNPAHNGPEGYYREDDMCGRVMARSFVDTMGDYWAVRSRTFNAENAAQPYPMGRGAPGSLAVLRGLDVKNAFLAETLFASNAADAEMLLSALGRSIIVCALRRALIEGLRHLEKQK